MEIRPVIASYTGETYRAIRAHLRAEVLRLIVRIAEAPLPAAEFDRRVVGELIAMRVLREVDGMVRLDTAVFSEDDIIRINAVVAPLGRQLAAALADVVAPLRDVPPETVTFLVGVLGVQQSLGEVLRESGLAVDWAAFGGTYARSKVDFHAVCDAQEALGPDLLNKSVFRGARYSAVFIGPGGRSYLLRPDAASGAASGVAGDAAGDAAGNTPDDVAALNTYLTDAYAALLAGTLDDAALRSAAERVGLWRDGAPAAPVITPETMARYAPTVDAVGAITASQFVDKMGTMRALLASTTSGRQGVPPENMMLHLWRYVRRSIARGLYAEGILTDRLPDTGLTTVFYANDVTLLARLLA
ncbi:MAG TPA: hypothetical protein GX714_16160 [Chloroflexi bacterium]|nr:hypothetical protein [Chloroflexota bacterium]